MNPSLVSDADSGSIEIDNEVQEEFRNLNIMTDPENRDVLKLTNNHSDTEDEEYIDNLIEKMANKQNLIVEDVKLATPVMIKCIDGEVIKTNLQVVGDLKIFNKIIRVHGGLEVLKEEIPMEVESSVLKPILVWLEDHMFDIDDNDDIDPFVTNPQDLNEKEMVFLNDHETQIIDFLNFGCYAQSKIFFEHCCRYCAQKFDVLSVSELREFFGIVDDFTERENEQNERDLKRFYEFASKL